MGMIQESEGTGKPPQEQRARHHYFGVGERLSGAFLARALYLGEVTGIGETRGGMFSSAYEEDRAAAKWAREDFEQSLPPETTHVLVTRNPGILGVMTGIAFRYIDMCKTPAKP